MPQPQKKALEIDEPVIHEGVCDASGAVPIDDAGEFFLVADDEDEECLLRMYKTAESGPPVREIKLDHDKLAAPGEELDLEAAAWVGKRIFWIGSHSRDKEGAKQKARRRLFSTRVTGGNKPSLAIDGEPYSTLIKDVKAHLAGLGGPWKKFTLDPDAPPKKGGLSIEGLAGTPDGELLIGLRSPLLDGKAIVLRLNNPAKVSAGKPADYAAPSLLDMGGMGVRSLEYCPKWKAFLVLGGSPGASAGFMLYRWDGASELKPVIDFSGMDLPEGVAPEGLFLVGDSLYILFDEGNRMEKDLPCKKSKRKSFRSIRVRGLVN